jgi:hypothetical protein
VLSGRLAEVDSEIEKVKARLQARYTDALADVLERHAEERSALSDQLAEAMQESASPLGEAWGRCQSLLRTIEGAPDPEEARVRLRAVIRRIVESVWVLAVARGSIRLAAVQIFFAGGKRRDYLILHRPAFGNAATHRERQAWCRTLATVIREDDLDLRRRADAAALAAELAALDLDRLQG